MHTTFTVRETCLSGHDLETDIHTFNSLTGSQVSLARAGKYREDFQHLLVQLILDTARSYTGLPTSFSQNSRVVVYIYHTGDFLQFLYFLIISENYIMLINIAAGTRMCVCIHARKTVNNMRSHRHCHCQFSCMSPSPQPCSPFARLQQLSVAGRNVTGALPSSLASGIQALG